MHRIQRAFTFTMMYRNLGTSGLQPTPLIEHLFDLTKRTIRHHNKQIEEVRLAKYNLYRYIRCIIYQSNWSGPFSLVVMTPDL